MWNWLSTMTDRIFAVLGAILLMQFPLFMEQYSTRLSGHVAELSYQVHKMEEIARESGKSLQQYIAKFEESKDKDFSSQGGLMAAMVTRKETLSHSLYSIRNSNLIFRPFVFLYQSDWEILSPTFTHYQVGLSISIESVIYAIIGVILGFYLYQLLHTFYLRIKEGFKRAQAKETPEKK